MENQSFSISDVPEEPQDAVKKSDIVEIKTVYIDASEFRNMKTDLSIVDGFMFGTGIILAMLFFSAIVLILGLLGVITMFNSLNPLNLL